MATHRPNSVGLTGPGRTVGAMAPSSLIFVVIVGVWAAFFVQYWIRRREHIATARSVDAFTETMRVLKVREQPRVDLSAPPRPSYAVSPLRPARPQVTVKRASALLGRPDHAWDESDAADTEDGGDARGGLAPGGERAAYLPALEVTRSTKGLTLLVGLAGSLVYALLSLTSVLVPWAVVVPLLVAVGGFLWLRADVQASMAARRRRARPAQRMAPAPAPTVRRAATGAGAADAAGAAVAASVPAGQGAVSDRRSSVYDIAAQDRPAAPAEAAARVAPAARVLLDEDDMPLTWDPVPVPRPTYTMKAAAVRRPVPEAPVPSSLVADLDDDVPEDFPLPRRVVGG